MLKQEKALRLCVDFRKLNKVTVTPAERKPIMEYLLARLSNARFFLKTKIDLSRMYLQIPRASESKKFTAFSTPTENLTWPVYLLVSREFLLPLRSWYGNWQDEDKTQFLILTICCFATTWWTRKLSHWNWCYRPLETLDWLYDHAKRSMHIKKYLSWDMWFNMEN